MWLIFSGHDNCIFMSQASIILSVLSYQDQMILFMGLADGESVLRTGPVTLHTESAIFITQQLTGAKFDIRYCNEDMNWTFISI